VRGFGRNDGFFLCVVLFWRLFFYSDGIFRASLFLVVFFSGGGRIGRAAALWFGWVDWEGFLMVKVLCPIREVWTI
jgi:hypothetical protein